MLPAVAIVQVVVGGWHTCARLDDGTVSCWGRNEDGELGDGTTDDRTTPIKVQGLTDAVWLSAELKHTCAQRRGGDVVCWGEVDGQKQPRPVSLGRDDIAQISGNCLRTTALNVSCVSDRFRHTSVDVAGVTNAVDLADQRGTGCVAHASGAVTCWLSPDEPEPVKGIVGAVDVAVGGNLACSRDRVGAVWCWQWGFAPPPPTDKTIFVMHGERLPVKPKRVVASGATELVDGGDRVCALSRGQTRCWNGDLRPVSLPPLQDVTSLALGLHSCAVRAGKEVVCWGDDSDGQLGDGWANARTTPLLVPGVHDAIGLETSYSNGIGGDQWSCALRRQGRPVCWGNTYPEDGNRANPNPRPLAGAGKVIARGWVPHLVDTPTTTSCSLTRAGNVHCDYEKTWPRREAPGITGAVQLAEGELMTCARERSGQIACWRQEAVHRVPAIDDATDLASGGDAACVVRADHSVWCWQSSRKNDVVSAPANGTPVKIAGLPEIARVSLGVGFACALAVDGGVWCWGQNTGGELGDGTRKTRSTPARVVGLDHVAEISAGTAHTCARLANGDVACWGATYGGQVGTRAGDHVDKPVTVQW